MRERTVLIFNFPSAQWRQAQELFRRIGREDLARAPKRPFGYTFVFESVAKLEEFYANARALGFGEDLGFARRERLYTKPELQAAPLLCLIVRTAPKGLGGPSCGTQYDLSQACPMCGTGAIQTSPLILKASEVPKKGIIFQTMHSEILVALTFAKVLKEARLSGLEFRQAQSFRERKPLPWLQLLAKQELPPMAPATRGILRERPCPHCRRDGYFHSADEPIEIMYRCSDVDLDALPDVVQTYERFGNSAITKPFKDSNFASPLLLVKPRVFSIFEQHKVRGVEFVPVQIMGGKNEESPHSDRD